MQNAAACYNAGAIYENGIKVKRNLKKALSYFNSSCNLKLDKACYKYNEILKSINNNLKD